MRSFQEQLIHVSHSTRHQRQTNYQSKLWWSSAKKNVEKLEINSIRFFWGRLLACAHLKEIYIQIFILDRRTNQRGASPIFKKSRLCIKSSKVGSTKNQRLVVCNKESFRLWELKLGVCGWGKAKPHAELWLTGQIHLFGLLYPSTN